MTIFSTKHTENPIHTLNTAFCQRHIRHRTFPTIQRLRRDDPGKLKAECAKSPLHTWKCTCSSHSVQQNDALDPIVGADKLIFRKCRQTTGRVSERNGRSHKSLRLSKVSFVRVCGFFSFYFFLYFRRSFVCVYAIFYDFHYRIERFRVGIRKVFCCSLVVLVSLRVFVGWILFVYYNNILWFGVNFVIFVKQYGAFNW